MRFILAGLILSAISTAAFAQVDGHVEAVGIQGYYRSNTWTPMLVRFERPQSDNTEFMLEVEQDDLDGDHAHFTKPVALTRAVAGAPDSQQKFWMYFIPQPSGLTAAGALAENLKVYVCDNHGHRIKRLDFDSPMKLIDLDRDVPTLYSQAPRSSRLILELASGSSKPNLFNEYENVVGAAENIVSTQISSTDFLPEDVKGYAAVDAILWMNLDPSKLHALQLKAIKDYVQQGGHLIISQNCRPGEWVDIKEAFGDLLPVDLSNSQPKQVHDLEVLHRLWKMREHSLSANTDYDPFDLTDRHLSAPIYLMPAVEKSNALVEEWTKDRQPWLVRMPVGLGSVTWVAQDLGQIGSLLAEERRAELRDPNTPEEMRTGMPEVWERVLGTRNELVAVQNPSSPPAYFDTRASVDTGKFGEQFTEFQSKGTGFVALAAIFFVIYWLAAGPISFLVLGARKKPGLNWFVYAGSAILATIITVAVVKLAVGGPSELKHLSFVRVGPDHVARIRSDIGLYVPHDDPQNLELKKADGSDLGEGEGSLTALPGVQDAGSGSTVVLPLDYTIDVSDSHAVSMQFRTSMKRLQAHWNTEIKASIEQTQPLKMIAARDSLAGVLTNRTGQDLSNVYLLFDKVRDPPDGSGYDPLPLMQVYYVDVWKDGAALNLATDWDAAKAGHEVGSGQEKWSSLPYMRNVLNKQLDNKWADLLLKASDESDTHHFQDDPRGFAVLSLYDELPATHLRFDNTGNPIDSDKVVILTRTGVRELDACDLVNSGSLVILAQGPSDAPLPATLEIDGEKIAGSGETFYQFILPVDFSDAQEHARMAGTEPPKPASAPTTRSAGGLR